MGKGPPRQEVRHEAEHLFQQVEDDLIALATFVRRLERRGLDLRSIPEEAVDRLHHMAELLASARAVAGKGIHEDEVTDATLEATSNLPRSGPRLLGSPMRLG